MRVLHGMSEVAGQGIYTVQGLQKNGIDARMAVWSRNIGGYDVDIDLKIDKSNKLMYPLAFAKMCKFAKEEINKIDVLHSHFGYTLLPYNWDLDQLKKRNIALFAEFHGSDIRFLFDETEREYVKTHWNNKKLQDRQKKHVSRLLQYCDGIILHDAELKYYIPSWVEKPIYIVPLRLDIGKFTPTYETMNRKPIVVHAPSHRSTKGTDRILKELEKMDEEFELVLVEGKTQSEVFEIYKQADIIIDQISVGTYGVFAIEAMALGKPVITYISDEMRKTFPENLPIVSADFDNISDKVSELIVDKELRTTLGKQGRAYAERYHDNVKVTAYLPEIYTGIIKNNNLFDLL